MLEFKDNYIDGENIKVGISIIQPYDSKPFRLSFYV